MPPDGTVRSVTQPFNFLIAHFLRRDSIHRLARKRWLVRLQGYGVPYYPVQFMDTEV